MTDEQQFLFKQKKNMPQQKESSIQESIILYCKLKKLRAVGYPGGIYLKDRKTAFAIIATMKKQGFVKGFPDLTIIGKSKIIFIELKVKSGGVKSKEQIDWIDYLKKQGFIAEFAEGFEEAKNIIDREFLL
jgi:ribosomal protein S8